MEEPITIEEEKAEDIWASLYTSRDYPGVSLQNIAEICGKVFDKAETEALIKDLKEVSRKK